MNPVVFEKNHLSIVYDADRITDPHARLLDYIYWQEQEAIRDSLSGRGNTYRVEAPFGMCMLRKMLRGGLPGRIIEDRYLFMGKERSRAFREFHLLNRLREADLPVPAPLAALCNRLGFSYQAALLTETK